MSYYTVDPCDLSCYGSYVPPTLASTIIFAECFDRAFCDQLVQELDASQTSPSGVHDLEKGEKVDYSHRSSEFCFPSPETHKAVNDRINFVVNYHVERDLIGGLNGKTLVMCEGAQFLKYDATNSGHFNRHHDDGYFANGQFQHVAAMRKFTTCTYINDDYEGGEFSIDTVKDPHGNILHRKMPVGTTFLFPSDQRFPHQVHPVTKGRRYSIVVWFDIV